jgi:ABC-2 type transport system permease protein
VQRGLRERFRDGAPYYVRLYFRLLGAHLRSEMQYRASFIAQILGTFLITGLDFAMVAILLTRFSALGGWVLEEVLFLYGTSTVSFAFAELLVGAFDDFDLLVVRGDFDRILLRPLPVVFQMLSGAVPVRRFGRMAQGVIAVVVALALLDLSWGVAQWAFFGLMILSGAAIFLAIFVAGATLAFWSPQSHEVVNIFTFGGEFMTSFPMHIYQAWLRSLFTFVIPMAFINYYPSLYLLGKDDPFGLPASLPFLSPFAALLSLRAAVAIWRVGVRHYQSTGT